MSQSWSRRLPSTIRLSPCNTPSGPAWCLAWYDYGIFAETQWKCALKKSGAIGFVPHIDIRLENQYSARITGSPPPEAPPFMERLKKLAGV